MGEEIGEIEIVNFWGYVDQVWDKLGSVKVTFFIFVGILVCSIPGTIFLQENVSSVDPGLQYDYAFWQFGQWIELFHSYHSFWYVGLLVLLSINLIICSYERWPGMWRLAFSRPVALSAAAIARKDANHKFQWFLETDLTPSKLKELRAHFEQWSNRHWIKFSTLQDDPSHWQVHWEKHRWARLANYLVHTSLLTIFAGAIWSGLYGFEGTLNIPEGSAVDTFLMFKEGGDSGLERPPGNRGLPNERMLDYRIEATNFDVEFYKDFPGRPKRFSTALNVIDRGTGAILSNKVITVNDPLEVGKYTFYQASYGELGDFRLELRVIRKDSLRGTGDTAFFKEQAYFSGKMGQVQKLPQFKTEFVPIKFHPDVNGYGPGVQIQEVHGDKMIGTPFWVLKNDPVYDFGRKSEWAVVLDDYKKLYFTGLQLAYDPGAPIYWLGCVGMLLGTFYALFFQHRKFYLDFKKVGDQTEVTLTGSTHRLPFTFEAELKKLAQEFKERFT